MLFPPIIQSIPKPLLQVYCRLEGQLLPHPPGIRHNPRRFCCAIGQSTQVYEIGTPRRLSDPFYQIGYPKPFSTRNINSAVNFRQGELSKSRSGIADIHEIPDRQPSRCIRALSASHGSSNRRYQPSLSFSWTIQKEETSPRKAHPIIGTKHFQHAPQRILAYVIQRMRCQWRVPFAAIVRLRPIVFVAGANPDETGSSNLGCCPSETCACRNPIKVGRVFPEKTMLDTPGKVKHQVGLDRKNKPANFVRIEQISAMPRPPQGSLGSTPAHDMQVGTRSEKRGNCRPPHETRSTCQKYPHAALRGIWLFDVSDRQLIAS